MCWPLPTDFVQLAALPDPSQWQRPSFGVCGLRAAPFMKRLYAQYGDSLNFVLIDTAYGHRHFERAQVEGQLRHFAQDFAKLPFPVALDLCGEVGCAWQIEGTPHWLAFDAGGELLPSVYGSQEGAQTRLEYLLAELAASSGQPSSGQLPQES